MRRRMGRAPACGLGARQARLCGRGAHAREWRRPTVRLATCRMLLVKDSLHVVWPRHPLHVLWAKHRSDAFHRVKR